MRKRLFSAFAATIAGAGLMAASSSAFGQTYGLPNVTVTTLGGGPVVQCGPVAGDTDGSTFDLSQFNGPSASAVDSLGNLYIADTRNNRVRLVSEAGNQAASFTETLYLNIISTEVNGAGKTIHVTNNAAEGVIGVAEDSANNLYVLDSTNGFLSKWDVYFNLLEVVAFTNTLSTTPPMASAIAISHDSSTNIFLAFTNGVIIRLNLTNSTFPAVGNTVGITPGGAKTPATYPNVHYVVSAFNWRPAGLALMPNGQLAVSDLMNNAIYLVGTNDNQTPVLYSGGNSNGYTTNLNGYTDGPSGYSQFNQPHGISASSDGHIVVADTMNNAVRIIDTNAVTTTLYGTSSTFWGAACCSCTPAVYPGWLDGKPGEGFTAAESRQPSSVTISSNGVVYVTELTYSLLREVTSTGLNPVFFTNVPILQPPTILITNPVTSSQFTTNSTINLGVSVSDPNTGGTVTNVEYFVNGQFLATVTASPFTFVWNHPPAGTNIISATAFDNLGLFAQSAPITIYVLNPQAPAVSITSPTNNAQVFNPTNLSVTAVATDPNPNGFVQTISLYANGSTLIGQQTVVSNGPVSFLWINPAPPGSNQLSAVALDNSGLLATSAPVTVYVTGLPPTAAPPPPPTLSPNFGYYPFCQTINVSLTASNQPIQLFYTTDGTTPTTNSLPVSNLASNNQVFTGSIQWCDPLHDLTRLQIVAFNGVAYSTVTFGQASPVNELGFVRGETGGAGDTLVTPIIVDLKSNGVLASVQFRVEVTPTAAGEPPITNITILPITTNDFITLVGPGNTGVPVSFSTFQYYTNNGVGLVVSAAGLSGFSVSRFAAVCVLAVQIPATAANGATYQLSVLAPSGTSDAQQTPVAIVPMTNQLITVGTVPYFAGDSSPGSGYNAGEFGDGVLNAADVNNALYASVGIRIPYPFTDAYNAMDVYPENQSEIGDNFITYLDWEHILLRAEGLETNNWVRFWANGARSHYPTNWSPFGPPLTLVLPEPESFIYKKALTPPSPRRNNTTNIMPGLVWFCQALVGAQTVTNVTPGGSYSIPIYEKTVPGYALAGFQFRATVTPNGSAPTISTGTIQFSPAPGMPQAASQLHGNAPNDVVCAWDLGSFPAPLQGSNLLGSISFQVPVGAQPGQSYTLHFSGVGGAADLNTEYQMESLPASLWVMSPALAPPQITSDEWRTAFFGSYTNISAGDSLDPDGDGASNWQEYIAGTNPTNGQSKLQFSSITAAGAPSQVTLSWLTAPGKTYLLQSSPSLGASSWTTINTASGDGTLFQYPVPNSSGKGNFYRICVQP
jgi:hypothetical protein